MNAKKEEIQVKIQKMMVKECLAYRITMDQVDLREVFYDATGKPDMFGPEEEVIGFELSDLSYLMRIMGLALERPVVTVDDFKPKGSAA